jgi:hypothetical protein
VPKVQGAAPPAAAGDEQDTPSDCQEATPTAAMIRIRPRSLRGRAGMIRHVMKVGFRAFRLDMLPVSRKVAMRAKNIGLSGVRPLSTLGWTVKDDE